MIKKLQVAFLLLFLTSSVFAQKLITGKVTDPENNEGAVGVNVVVKGTTVGTVTDLDGNYSVQVPENGTHLVFSFVGYQTQEIEIGSQSTINTKMVVEAKTLQELIVVGYGVQKKSDVTGAIASVKAEELTKLAVSGVSQALQGRAAGVQVTANSGQPGSEVQVRIRGVGTVNNSDPLYVVDGFPVAGIGYLNPQDIESMEILKDASASAIYGARAANGVVLITTKKGKSGNAVVSYDGYYGVQNSWKAPDMLNGQQWIDIMTESRVNGKAIDPNERPFTLSAPSDNASVSTDWFKEATRSATIQSHNVSVAGGNDKSKYYMSANYFGQQGIIKGTDFERITARLNADHQVNDRVKVGTYLTVSHSNRLQGLEDYFHGVTNAAQKLDPLTPVYDANGLWVSSPYMDINNPVGTIERNNNRSKMLQISGNAYLDIKIIEGLTFRSNLGLDFARSDSYNFLPKFDISADERNLRNSVFRGYAKTDMYLWENTLNYTKTFAQKHNVTVLAGITRQESRSEGLNVTRFDVPSNSPDFQYVSAATDLSPTTSGGASEWAFLSYLGRINYSYDNRYLFTASVRQDGSSKFAKANRYGVFPSAALGWRIINESFMKGISGTILSDLKIRAGWGQIGNSEIPAYSYSTAMSNEGRYHYVLGAGANEKVIVGVGPSSIGNSVIKWETVESSNIGLDASFLNDKLTFSAEYFIKDTKDMLLVQPVPTYIGYNSTTGGTIAPYSNSGAVRNSGFEFTLGWQDQVGEFKYNINANLTSIKNEVVSLGDGKLQFIAGGVFQVGATTRTQVGSPIGTFYGYVVDGIFQNQEEVNAHPLGKTGARPGDFRFKDLDNNGKIDDADRQQLGSPFPDFTYGINASAEYKGLDLSLFIQGVQGNSVFNAMKYFNLSGGFPYNKHTDILKSWGRPGADNTVPIVSSKDRNNNFRVSSFYVEDGSYIRLKNLQIGYTLPQDLLSKFKIQKLRFYVSGQNLLTVTKYKGLDPEIGQWTSDQTSSGLDVGTYPQARVWMFGANISF